MKFFVAIALIATVASAAIVRPTVVSGELAQVQEIVAAISSPSTDPATAAALEQMLLDVLGVKPEPVAIGPAIIESSPISVGPAIIDANPETAPTPAADAASSTPIQIILNINLAALEAGVIMPEPVQIVETAPSAPTPIQVVETAPVQVVESAPVEPVAVGTPVLPAPVVSLPEELN